MPETADQGMGEEKQSVSARRRASLLHFLREAHDTDHGILEALGIKHPHVPLLGAIEMLRHLKEDHVDESASETSGPAGGPHEKRDA